MQLFLLCLFLALASSQRELEELIITPPVPLIDKPTTTEATAILVNKDGLRCQCVPYYQCDSEDVEDQLSRANHSYVIDTRDEEPCPHYSEVCCVNPSKNKPQPDPTKVKGCGYRNPEGFGRKFEGAETNFGEFPWVVALLDTRNSSYVGAGVIISPEVVMTVAHIAIKYAPESLKIRAGEWDTQTQNEIYDFQERGVKEMYIHEDYNKSALWNNIALLRLAKPLELTEHINAICLPEQDEVFDSYKNCIANGWGKDRFEREGQYAVDLRKVELNMVPHSSCESLLKKTRLRNSFRLHNSFVCAVEHDLDHCKAMDGGAPLACPTGDNRYKLTGLVAWGLGCGSNGPNVPAVYTNVSAFTDLVNNKLKSWSTSVAENS